MKLKNFRIQRFRCIKDSGQVYLSGDNITTIIGQNESGKSSVLDALYAFHTGVITDDDIDMTIDDGDTMPEITCTFELDQETVDVFGFSEEYLKKIKSQKYEIEVLRWWNQDKSVNDFDIYSSSVLCEEQNESESEKEVITDSDYDLLIKFINENIPEFVIFKQNSGLPETISIEDIKNNSEVIGKDSVMNLLELLGINADYFETPDNSVFNNKLNKLNKDLNAEISQYRQQILGSNIRINVVFERKYYPTGNPNAGKPYLLFGIKDKLQFKPSQRSQGVKRFLAFFLQLGAIAKRQTQGELVYLIDEPGMNLHANAQRDLLNYFETRSNELNIVFTTHSPFLLDDENLHRIVAIEREDNGDDDSVIYSKIYNFNMIGRASGDTLFGLTTKLGIRLSDQSEIKTKNNIILEEMSAMFYIKAFERLLGYTFSQELAFIPCTGVSNISTFANLLTGRGLGFIAVMDDDTSGKSEYKKLNQDNGYSEDILIKMDGYDGIEDLFTIADFERYLGRQTGYNGKNSKYVKDKKIPKAIQAKVFYTSVLDGVITNQDIEEATKNNFRDLCASINSKLQ